MIEGIIILDVPFDRVTRTEALEAVFKWIAEGRRIHVATPNPEFLLEAQKNQVFHEILKKTDLNIADGIGILWAATYVHKTRKNKSKIVKILKGIFLLITLVLYPKYCRQILKERVSGVDLMLDICKKAADLKLKIFLLGAAPGIAEKTAEKLTNNFPSLQITGVYTGNPEEKNIAEKINQSGADILFVAFGAPKQEYWIYKNLPKLSNIKLAMGVGGAFDFICGKIRRAPLFMRKIGLEWLYRLIMEPKRLRRIFNAVIKFPLEIFKKY